MHTEMHTAQRQSRQQKQSLKFPNENGSPSWTSSQLSSPDSLMYGGVSGTSFGTGSSVRLNRRQFAKAD
jgi:hypothetical protein